MFRTAEARRPSRKEIQGIIRRGSGLDGGAVQSPWQRIQGAPARRAPAIRDARRIAAGSHLPQPSHDRNGSGTSEELDSRALRSPRDANDAGSFFRGRNVFLGVFFSRVHSYPEERQPRLSLFFSFPQQSSASVCSQPWETKTAVGTPCSAGRSPRSPAAFSSLTVPLAHCARKFGRVE